MTPSPGTDSPLDRTLRDDRRKAENRDAEREAETAPLSRLASMGNSAHGGTRRMGELGASIAHEIAP